MSAFYTNTLSVRPGERFQIHASARGPSRLEIARVGAKREIVATYDAISSRDGPRALAWIWKRSPGRTLSVFV